MIFPSTVLEKMVNLGGFNSSIMKKASSNTGFFHSIDLQTSKELNNTNNNYYRYDLDFFLLTQSTIDVSGTKPVTSFCS